MAVEIHVAFIITRDEQYVKQVNPANVTGTLPSDVAKSIEQLGYNQLIADGVSAARLRWARVKISYGRP